MMHIYPDEHVSILILCSSYVMKSDDGRRPPSNWKLREDDMRAKDASKRPLKHMWHSSSSIRRQVHVGESFKISIITPGSWYRFAQSTRGNITGLHDHTSVPQSFADLVMPFLDVISGGTLCRDSNVWDSCRRHGCRKIHRLSRIKRLCNARYTECILSREITLCLACIRCTTGHDI